MSAGVKLQLVLLLAGLLGGALHAWITQSQSTLSKKSLVDVVIAGLTAVLIPQYIPSLIPSGDNLIASFATVALISYMSPDLVQNILGKLGVSIQGGTPPAPKP